MPKRIQVLFFCTITGLFFPALIAQTGSGNSGDVDIQNCMACHIEKFQEWKTSKHASVENGVLCTACHKSHDGFTPTELVMEPKQLCDSCHVHRAVLEGKGAKGIEETRSMHSAIACTGCHMSDGNHRVKVIMPDDPDLSENRVDSCTACHKDDSREIRAAQIKDYRAWYNESMDPLKMELEAFENTLKENPGLLNVELQAKLDDIKSNLAIIMEDGSDGIHNLDYALEIMALAKRDLKKIKAAIE